MRDDSIKLTGSELPESCLRYIGGINVNFNLLSITISSLAAILINPQKQQIGQIITAEMSFLNLLNLISSLVKFHNLGRVKNDTLKQLIKESIIVSQKRNQIMHSVWTVSENKDEVKAFKISAKQKNGLETKFTSLNNKELKKISAEMLDLASRFSNFMFNLSPR